MSGKAQPAAPYPEFKRFGAEVFITFRIHAHAVLHAKADIQ